ncbi:MAG TPA: hypothetical protein VK721_06450 [Solirubrobacteraceae bacterium]|jgi:hypothetical protein|nr:hypothetical protein [Solirubrobacteraceae bacterium]
MMTKRAPWHHEDAARELIAAVVDGRYPSTEFARRFGDELAMDVYDGEDVRRALAWMLALERAADALLKTSDDPVLEASFLVTNHCEHWQSEGTTYDLHLHRVYCRDCTGERTREPEDWRRRCLEERPGPEDFDRCGICGELGQVEPIRVPLGARFVEGRACETCRSYAGILR